jgi:uncharacterized protein YndB with AHSA1/START domain
MVSDPYSLPRWWPSLQRVEQASPEAWTKVFRSSRGKTIRADFARVSAEPPERLVWRQQVAGSAFEKILADSVTEISLKSVGEDATEVELCVRQRLRGFARLGWFLVRRATGRQLVRALDELEYAAVRP